MAEDERERKGTTTTREAGRMGGEKGGERSWTADPSADRPDLDEDTRREVERIREKERRGEELTTHEAGVLGGAKRVRQGGGGEER